MQKYRYLFSQKLHFRCLTWFCTCKSLKQTISANTTYLKPVWNWLFCCNYVKAVLFQGQLILTLILSNWWTIQSECGKMLTRKTPNRDTFHAVTVFKIHFCFSWNHHKTYGLQFTLNQDQLVLQVYPSDLLEYSSN